MNIDELYMEAIKSLEDIIAKLKLISNNPETILTEIFDAKDYRHQLTGILNLSNKYKLNNLREYIYGLLIPFLNKKLGEEYNFKYDNYGMTAAYQGYKLGFINIQYRVLTIWNPLNIESHKEFLKYLKEELNTHEKWLEKFEKAGMNPFKMTGNPIEFFRFIIFLKKFKEMKKYEIQNLNKKIKSCTKDIKRTEEQIIEEENIKKEIENHTKRLINFFNNYSYEIKKN